MILVAKGVADHIFSTEYTGLMSFLIGLNMKLTVNFFS